MTIFSPLSLHSHPSVCACVLVFFSYKDTCHSELESILMHSFNLTSSLKSWELGLWHTHLRGWKSAHSRGEDSIVGKGKVKWDSCSFIIPLIAEYDRDSKLFLQVKDLNKKKDNFLHHQTPITFSLMFYCQILFFSRWYSDLRRANNVQCKLRIYLSCYKYVDK